MRTITFNPLRGTDGYGYGDEHCETCRGKGTQWIMRFSLRRRQVIGTDIPCVDCGGKGLYSPRDVLFQHGEEFPDVTLPAVRCQTRTQHPGSGADVDSRQVVGDGAGGQAMVAGSGKMRLRFTPSLRTVDAAFQDMRYRVAYQDALKNSWASNRESGRYFIGKDATPEGSYIVLIRKNKERTSTVIATVFDPDVKSA